jgi:hypothetical protein
MRTAESRREVEAQPFTSDVDVILAASHVSCAPTLHERHDSDQDIQGKKSKYEKMNI